MYAWRPVPIMAMAIRSLGAGINPRPSAAAGMTIGVTMVVAAAALAHFKNWRRLYDTRLITCSPTHFRFNELHHVPEHGQAATCRYV